jgi:hypothetical protein
LGWEAKLGIDRMCADTWRWQQQNPNGYSWIKKDCIAVLFYSEEAPYFSCAKIETVMSSTLPVPLTLR